MKMLLLSFGLLTSLSWGMTERNSVSIEMTGTEPHIATITAVNKQTPMNINPPSPLVLPIEGYGSVELEWTPRPNFTGCDLTSCADTFSVVNLPIELIAIPFSIDVEEDSSGEIKIFLADAIQLSYVCTPSGAGRKSRCWK